MITRLTPVPSTGRSVTDPTPRAILAVDVEGSTQRTNPERGEFRRIMYALLYRALRATGIGREHLEDPADRGDGVLLMFRPHDDVPKTLLLGQLIPKLAALLVEHNATVAQPALRLRLRAVLHAGEIHDDGWGFYGEDIDVAFRLLNSPSVKKALKEEPVSPLVLVVSEEIHSAIVRHGDADPGPLIRSVNVRVAKLRRRGWVHIPVPAPAERTLQLSRPKPPSRSPTLAIAPPPLPLEARPAEPDAPWESALSAVYQALEQHLDQTEGPYDVEAGLARLKEWTSTRQMSERPADYQAVKGHQEVRSEGLVSAGAAATGFPGWWPRVLSA